MYEIRKNGFEGSAGHFYDLCRCQSLDHRQAGIPGAGSVVVSAESGIPGFRGIGLGGCRDRSRSRHDNLVQVQGNGGGAPRAVLRRHFPRQHQPVRERHQRFRARYRPSPTHTPILPAGADRLGALVYRRRTTNQNLVRPLSQASSKGLENFLFFP